MTREERIKKLVEQLIALDYINLTSYQPYSMEDEIERTTQQIAALYEPQELEQTATIGVAPNDHEAYKTNLKYLQPQPEGSLLLTDEEQKSLQQFGLHSEPIPLAHVEFIAQKQLAKCQEYYEALLVADKSTGDALDKELVRQTREKTLKVWNEIIEGRRKK